MKKILNMVTGAALVLLGCALLLKTLGILEFSIGFSDYWPIGLILIGVALIYRMRLLAFVFLMFTIVLGGLYIAQTWIPEIGDYRIVEQLIPYEEGISDLNLDLGFGAGGITISAGSLGNLIHNSVSTSSQTDPELIYNKVGSTAWISLERSPKAWGKELWGIELRDDISTSIKASYGAADFSIDLSGLQVDSLVLESGASSTDITFGRYPTRVEISTGASLVGFHFPEGMGVKMEIDSGATSVELDEFYKKGGTYFSPGYDEARDNIEIQIEAGASSISGEII